MSEAVIRMPCDRAEFGPVQLVPVGRRQQVSFFQGAGADERCTCVVVLTWPNDESTSFSPPATVTVGNPPQRGAGD